jgi:Tfp pilus assembly protein PilO
MALDKISNREQVLIFIVVTTFVAGGYGLFRFMPQLKALTELQAAVKVSQEKIKNPKFPDEPIEDIENLKDRLDDLESEMVNVRANLDALEKNLAPTDSQEMVLKISEAARAAGVRVIENVPYLVQKKDGEAATQANKRKLSKRAQRKVDREARKQALKTGSNAASGSATGGIPKEGELIYRLVNELETSRPFQRISVEGNFADLQKFIQSVRSMPWQATIVKLDIDVAIQTPPQGMPQPITARMIIAI